MAGKQDVVDAVAAAGGRSRTEVADTLEAILAEITGRLRRGERVQLSGFGSFSVSHRGERRGRNPATGEPITIPASNAVRFKAGKDLAAALNG